jgi:hypothetical protein
LLGLGGLIHRLTRPRDARNAQNKVKLDTLTFNLCGFDFPSMAEERLFQLFYKYHGSKVNGADSPFGRANLTDLALFGRHSQLTDETVIFRCEELNIAYGI